MTSPDPALSLVLVAHNMARELPRTLASLAPGYQRGVAATAYEVIVVDNGSPTPVDINSVAPGAANVRLLSIEEPQPSPARAINVGLANARGDVIGVMIDGARIVTPGIVRFALAGAALAPRSVITTPNWVLGYDSSQTKSLQSGYSQAREDALLAGIGWPQDGYRLFEIAAPAGTSSDGWFGLLPESNALFMPRALWDELGGVDERFDQPAGGWVNLDLLRRAYELSGATAVTLLGEATFHQLHGDMAVRGDRDAMNARNVAALAQYESLRGGPWRTPMPPGIPLYVGTLPPAAMPLTRQSIIEPLTSLVFRPIAQDRPSESGVLGDVLQLAGHEADARRFAAAAEICRVARARLGDVPQLMEILALTSRWLRIQRLEAPVQVEVNIGRGDCLRLFGEMDAAEHEYRAALALDPTAQRAHLGLAHIRMPGPGYISYLRKIHERLAPKAYLEIGVCDGPTLTLARPPTIAVGVDPEAKLLSVPATETRVFPQTSDAFFATADVASVFGDLRVDLAFIDGLHQFDQVLRDFINVERWARPGGVIVIHDTLPFDELTQRRDRASVFWTGDVWRLVLALKDSRPDLDVFTIPAFPAGLTVVSRLDPTSTVLAENYDTIAKRYADIPFSEVEVNVERALNVIPNDRDGVSARLASR